MATPAQPSPICMPSDSGPVVPTTPLVTFLERLQETALDTFGGKNFDPKLYVDLSLKSNLSTTQDAFDDLPRTPNGSVSASDLNGFIHRYLNGAEMDLVYAEPTDFVPEPEGFLPKVKNPEVRAWALEVHSLWKNLSRRVADGVLERPEFHTLLPLAKPVVVPGSRQPPLLSAMVYDIYNRIGDMEFARNSLPALVKEHKFWSSGVESFVSLAQSDQETASKLLSASEKHHLYRELASAAETGWDFSTRWMR
ncbi:alpha,alpha-trehalase [Sarracenia purpurea var. burkii]